MFCCYVLCNNRIPSGLCYRIYCCTKMLLVSYSPLRPVILGQHMGIILLRPHRVPVLSVLFQDLCVSLQFEDVHAGMFAGKQKTEDWLLLSY